MTITVVNKYKEPNHIYCGRGSPVGNPFKVTNGETRDSVCDSYAVWFHEQIKPGVNEPFRQYLLKIFYMAQKQDVNLGCFCAPKRCHCDTIKAFLDKQLLLP